MNAVLITLATVFFAGHAAATPEPASYPNCTVQSRRGATCMIAVDLLHPTQMSYGEIEVKRRAEKIAALSPKQLSNYLSSHIVPLVIGPQGRFYATDRHHLALAMARVYGHQAKVIATIIDDWKMLEKQLFWQHMVVSGRLYPFAVDQAGPLPAAQLPESMLELKDDPWRSLANGLQKAGGYRDDSGVPYADFLWAQFLRPLISEEAINTDFDAAVRMAKRLACSPAASAMPGFTSDCLSSSSSLGIVEE